MILNYLNFGTFGTLRVGWLDSQHLRLEGEELGLARVPTFGALRKGTQRYSIPMRPYQIPFFSEGERVYFDSRTGYCFRKEQNFPMRYALS